MYDICKKLWFLKLTCYRYTPNTGRPIRLCFSYLINNVMCKSNRKFAKLYYFHDDFTIFPISFDQPFGAEAQQCCHLNETLFKHPNNLSSLSRGPTKWLLAGQNRSVRTIKMAFASDKGSYFCWKRHGRHFPLSFLSFFSFVRFEGWPHFSIKLLPILSQLL